MYYNKTYREHWEYAADLLSTHLKHDVEQIKVVQAIDKFVLPPDLFWPLLEELQEIVLEYYYF